MVLLALTTGFRRNEILGLQWEWIDFGAMRIDLRGQLYWRRIEGSREREPAIVRCKYDSEREVPLFSGLAELLGSRREASGFVFRNPNTGKPWKEGKPTEHFLEPAYEACGLRRPGRMWHQLRHTYASVLAAGGVKRHEVEQLMGHKTTARRAFTRTSSGRPTPTSSARSRPSTEGCQLPTASTPRQERERPVALWRRCRGSAVSSTASSIRHSALRGREASGDR
jgi:integrase